MKHTHYVGIDVSKETFDVAIRVDKDTYFNAKYSNEKRGINLLLKSLKRHKINSVDCLICMEHTGIYTHLLLRILKEKGFNIWLERSINIKRSLGLKRGKSDKVDAERIAEYSFRFNDCCSLWEPPRKEIERLRNLISLRSRLLKVKKLITAPIAELDDVKHVDLKDTSNLTLPVLQKIKAQLLEVENQIKELIKSDIHLNRLTEIITSVDGVGKVTAWSMIVYTNEFKNYQSSRQFACYSGVVPFEHSSGTSIYRKPRVSHFANKKMKELLHLSALSATIMKGELNNYYIRKVAEGKNKMLVLNNIRNKLVHRIFSCVSQNRKYEKNYIHNVV